MHGNLGSPLGRYADFADDQTVARNEIGHFKADVVRAACHAMFRRFCTSAILDRPLCAVCEGRVDIGIGYRYLLQSAEHGTFHLFLLIPSSRSIIEFAASSTLVPGPKTAATPWSIR